MYFFFFFNFTLLLLSPSHEGRVSKQLLGDEFVSGVKPQHTLSTSLALMNKDSRDCAHTFPLALRFPSAPCSAPTAYMGQILYYILSLHDEL